MTPVYTCSPEPQKYTLTSYLNAGGDIVSAFCRNLNKNLLVPVRWQTSAIVERIKAVFFTNYPRNELILQVYGMVLFLHVVDWAWHCTDIHKKNFEDEESVANWLFVCRWKDYEYLYSDDIHTWKIVPNKVQQKLPERLTFIGINRCLGLFHSKLHSTEARKVWSTS